MTAWPAMDRRVAIATVLFGVLLLLATNRRGVPSMVLDPRRHATGQDTNSGGDSPSRTAPAAADTGPVAASQSQQRQLDAQLAQAAGDGAVTAQGQLARLPAMQRPRPAADGWWHAMHSNFTATVKDADEGEGFDTIFYGDSLVEMWRGTRADKPFGPRAELPGIFHDHFQVGGRAAAFGMSGDVVATLHWRLLHGELPRKQHPRHVVVLIGTNDLTHAKVEWEESAGAEQRDTAADAIAEAAPAVSQQIGLVLGLLRRRLARSRILLLALLPRDEADAPRPREWPTVYTKGLSIVNERLQLYAKQHSEEVTFLDCGAIFFAGPVRLNDQLLPDALHPSAAGATLFSECIGKAIGDLHTLP